MCEGLVFELGNQFFPVVSVPEQLLHKLDASVNGQVAQRFDGYGRSLIFAQLAKIYVDHGEGLLFAMCAHYPGAVVSVN